ncbi:D-2-hydroxyacid dehydrogenase [Vibrio sp. ZSDE26]|uniref:D-2-hydroxyacid dehydrogenase n=1 Tax=Vibrio amylolyticus TaxID=2847292 RepID=A0A9X1XLU1_9VIBR|nr:D-2-hydroxyacid dehydrogenase [Vibrio amylolyticus]MCK6265307.1 D-2-hydroxyacid dehydrogenase [Vibrio amylolyticus]
MNNLTNKLYIDTEQDALYQELIEQLNLQDLTITDDPESANILLASPPRISTKLEQYSCVEWVQSIYAGVDALSTLDKTPKFTLTNVKGIFGQQIAEYVLGYAISHFRHFDQYKEQQVNGLWHQIPYQTIDTKSMLILGTGSIGNHVAQMAKALGMTVYGVNRSGIPPKDSNFDETYHIQELRQTLSQVDIVVSTLPNTKETNGLLNRETLEQCNGVLVFNVGRGPTINEEGLLAAVDGGSVTHAYLDVFNHEPLDRQHAFWNHPSITVTPHIAAISVPEQVVEIFQQNYRNWHSGFKLENVVDLSKGY